MVGAGHSFTPLVCTDATLLSLDGLSGVDQVNTEFAQASIWAGTRLFNLGAIFRTDATVINATG